MPTFVDFHNRERPNTALAGAIAPERRQRRWERLPLAEASRAGLSVADSDYEVQRDRVVIRKLRRAKGGPGMSPGVGPEHV